MPEGLWIWGPWVVGGVLGFASWRAGEASVFMRSWIPSWRFFENTGNVPLLEYRQETGGEAGAWKPVPNPGRTAKDRLYYSPRPNSFHAFETLVLDFALNPGHPDLEFCLVDEGARRVRRIHPDTGRIDFKLSWSDLTGRVSEPVWEGVWNSPSS